MRGSDTVDYGIMGIFLNHHVGLSLQRERAYRRVKHIDPTLPIKEVRSDWRRRVAGNQMNVKEIKMNESARIGNEALCIHSLTLWQRKTRVGSCGLT